MWTTEQKSEIVKRSFKYNVVACPEDGADLDIQHAEAMQNTTVFVRCRLCKQEFDHTLTPTSQVWTKEQMESFIRRRLQNKTTDCPNCDTPLEVRVQGMHGAGNADLYTVICKYCLLYESLEF